MAGLFIRALFMVEITRLFWRKAFTSDSFELGEVESAELDTNSWQITNFYVSLTDEATKRLRFKRPFLGKVIVCLPASTVKSVKETFVLNKTLDELQTLKECKE